MPLPLEISCREVHEKRVAGERLLLIDCREQDEYDLVALPNARLVPLSAWLSAARHIEPEANSHVIVYCHHGARSAQAAMWLRENGLPDAQSMAGGIDRWAIEIEPGLVRY